MTVFKRYEPHRGEFIAKRNGVMLSMTEGEAVPFAIFNLEDRGNFYIGPGTDLYEGMIVGLHSKENDLTVNLTKGKKLNNIRNSGSADEAVKLTPYRKLTLEVALEFIEADELVEVTPERIRLRKALLKEVDRKRAARSIG